jgi:hypothetical protein
VLLLFFSGHGERASDRLYFCLSDTERDRLEESGLPASEVSGHVRSSPSQRVVILLDCCHSGAYKAGLDTSELQGKGRLVLASTHGRGTSPDAVDAEELSPFSAHVCGALKGGAAVDGRVTFYTLASHVEESVQEARRFVEEGRGDLDLARSGGLSSIGRSWLDVFDEDGDLIGRRPVRWPTPPEHTEARAVLTAWAARQWFMPIDLVQDVRCVEGVSVAGITVHAIVDECQEHTVEWSVAKAERLTEYRGPLRHSESLPHIDIGGTWAGARLGTKKKRICSACGGQRFQSCSECRSGRIDCPEQQPCPRCGWREHAAETRMPAGPASLWQTDSHQNAGRQETPGCPHCSDARAVRCELCQGAGWRFCPTCEGSAAVNCTQCEGEGKTTRFTHGTVTRGRRRFRAAAGENSPAVTTSLRKAMDRVAGRVVGRLDEVRLLDVPQSVREELSRGIQDQLSGQNQAIRDMNAAVDIRPAAKVTFHDGRTTRTALLLGDNLSVRLGSYQQIAIRAYHTAKLLHRTTTSPRERQRLLAAIAAILLITTVIALLLAGT